MCGIVAAIVNAACARASRGVVPFLVEGLKQLEYRGYDSTGLVVNHEGCLHRERGTSRVHELEQQVVNLPNSACGIAHTRWATHGAPNVDNAHPHISGKLALVHNGIIENYLELGGQLREQGFTFSSDTDSEVIVHLIQSIMQDTPDLLDAVCEAVKRLKGAFAFAVMHADEPLRIVLACEAAPLLLGIAPDGTYAASDVAGLITRTRRIVYLENGDIAEIRPDRWQVVDENHIPQQRAITNSQVDIQSLNLGHYQHFMQKEIFEQVEALGNTLEIVGAAHDVQPWFFGADARHILERVGSVCILACGTSYYAGMVARYWIESMTGIPCRVEIASEYRYRKPARLYKPLIIAISQSGETADTLAALHYARVQGEQETLAICNVPESSIMRACSLKFITRAGIEIGVASTKAFTTQLVALYMLSLVLAKLNARLTLESEQIALRHLRHLPLAAQKVLELEKDITRFAEKLASHQHALFLGRGAHFPIALEGALKLKEISYIHAEGYPAGELKHGPLALVDADMPVIAIAPNDELLHKLHSNLQEVRARGSHLYIFADSDTRYTSADDMSVISLPEYYGDLSPILHVIPLQLMAYHVALIRGTDIDKPRNLAKSVTVE